MDSVDYWPMAREYSVWNATIAALQFWTADLETHMLSSIIEQVYNTCFYSTSMHLLCQLSDEILFDHFITTLKAAFESKLALEDDGYDSGSKNFNIPKPLRRTSKIHHISSVKNAPWTLIHPHHAALVPRSHTADKFTDAYLSVLLRKMMITPHQMSFHPQTVHHWCSITQMPSSNHPPSAP